MREIVGWLIWVWAEVREMYFSIMPIRFSVIAVALVGLAFGFSDQGQDALRLAAETNSTLITIMFPLAVALLAAMSWYWSRQFLRITYPHVEAPSRWIRDWAPRLLGGLAFVLVGLDVVKAGRQYGGGGAPRAIWVYAGLFFLAGPVFVYLAYKRRDWLPIGEPTPVKNLGKLLEAAPLQLYMLIFFALVVFLAATFAPQRVGLLGAPTIVALSAALWVPFGGMLVHLGHRLRLPILSSLLVLAFAFSKCNDNHIVTRRGAMPRGQRPNVAEQFRDWTTALNAKYGSGPQPVFIVVTEGGGIRAAYWTAAVLASLHDQLPNFSDHVFAISSVSGGSLGATTYATLLATPSLQGKPIRTDAMHALRGDSLGPTLAAALQPDFAQRFLPWPILPDRAAALEGAWEYGWRNRTVTGATMATRFRLWLGRTPTAAPGPYLDDGFLQVFGPKNHTLFPSLFLNSTVVEKGARGIVSNLRIESWRLRNRDDDPEPSEFSSVYDVLAELDGDINISTATHLSARFPYISPAGTIRAPHFGSRTLPRPPNETTCLDCAANGKSEACESCNQNCCHLVDGGYFENSGAVTAAEILTTIRRPEKPPNLYPIVIFISATEDPLPPYVPQARVGEVTTPPSGLLSVRGGRGDLAVAQLKRAMAPGPPVPAILKHSYIDFVLTQRDTVLPLGWALSEQARNVIDASVGLKNGPNWLAVQQLQHLLGVPEPAQADVVACAAYEALPTSDGRKRDVPVTGPTGCMKQGASR
jgi:hypothetical protein